MVLNKNVDNQFLENEQIAFSPALVVPGIYYSDDKLLQTRLFSYTDTQRYRLGANYLQLPINAPKNAHHNNHYDGQLNTMHREGEVNYFPSRFDKAQHAPAFPVPRGTVQGDRVKAVISKENNFLQAGERFRSWDPERQQRFVTRVTNALNAPRVTNELKTIWIGYWTQADASLGKQLQSMVKMGNM
mmetsp:Transcript_21469/g.36931  ORF Transcript_21469/g.36931 Transcript_21469/m.36931 type:complete len:187 (+) Transcript_21469:2-562(+)